MTRRVYIVHGWDGNPQEGWFPWLKVQLEQRGFVVVVPALPDAAYPQIDAWVPALAQAVGEPDEQTFFIGHSLGCQTIARYVESLPENTTIGGALFVGGFFKHLSGLDDDEQDLARHWLDTPVNLATVKKRMPKSMAIFSDDDPWVPLDNQDDFRDQLGSTILVVHAAGHFSGIRDKAFEVPLILEHFLTIVE